MKSLTAVAFVVLVPALSAGQAPTASTDGSAGAQPTFRGGVELVALTVTVTDSRQQHVNGLTAGDFVVLEDGVEQPLSFFALSEVPLDVALLIDASSSMHDRIAVARAAVLGLAKTLKPEDRASLIEFRDGVVMRQAMTGSRDRIEAAMEETRTGGGTALYNALYIALSEFRRARPAPAEVRRQAIVVLSDGLDTSSLINHEDVLDQARRSGVTIYVVAVRPQAESRPSIARRDDFRAVTQSDYVMRQLARETGGQCFFATQIDELKSIYATIGNELAQQYALGYTPQNTNRNGAWRQVLVRLPGQPKARVRTRTGYFAEGPNRLTLTSTK